MFKKPGHRTLFRIGLIYVVVSWLIIQILGTLTPVFDWPWILARGIAFMLIGGYPLIMMMAWMYQLTHQGKKGWEKEIDTVTKENTVKKNNLVFNIMIGSLVLLSIATLMLDIYVLNKSDPVNGTDGESGNAGINVEETNN